MAWARMPRAAANGECACETKAQQGGLTRVTRSAMPSAATLHFVKCMQCMRGINEADSSQVVVLKLLTYESRVALQGVSHSVDPPVGLTSPAFHACGQLQSISRMLPSQYRGIPTFWTH